LQQELALFIKVANKNELMRLNYESNNPQWQPEG
jgi:hypothetical protein